MPNDSTQKAASRAVKAAQKHIHLMDAGMGTADFLDEAVEHWSAAKPPETRERDKAISER